MKFADHDPNVRESEAHAVPGPTGSMYGVTGTDVTLSW
jgi:hypothetical protein